jgi:hypothetical protein
MDDPADIPESLAALSLGCTKQPLLSKVPTRAEQQLSQHPTTDIDQVSSIFGPDSIVYKGGRIFLSHVKYFH